MPCAKASYLDVELSGLDPCIDLGVGFTVRARDEALSFVCVTRVMISKGSRRRDGASRSRLHGLLQGPERSGTLSGHMKRVSAWRNRRALSRRQLDDMSSDRPLKETFGIVMPKT